MINPDFKKVFSDLSGIGSISHAIGYMLGQLYDKSSLPNTGAVEKLLRQLDRQPSKNRLRRH